MPQDGDMLCYESFNSFLAGALLKKKKISNFDFCFEMNRFEELYNVSVIGLEGDGDIRLSIYFSDNDISLNNDYDSVVRIDGIDMTVNDYLYTFTTPRVREYFEISLRDNMEKNNSIIKKIFKRKVKTKACV